MSSSPFASSPREQTLLKESPSRYHNRYSERFKSLSNSPPRENYTSRTSPLKPTNYKLLDYEIKSEHQDSPNLLDQDEEVEQVAIQQRPDYSKRQTESDHKLPSYMHSTKSFHNKTHIKRDPSQSDNLLRPRTQGGITKRVGTSKIPRYQSTTTINAIEDIKGEMTPEDIYIPMAARIKLFEKGLGNGSNKPAPIVSRYSSTSSKKSEPASTNSSPQPKKSNSTSSRASSTLSRHQPESSTLPHYASHTTVSLTKKKEIQQTKTTSKQASSNSLPSKEPKPFHFATNERAHHFESFKERLNLWRDKDKQAVIENSKRAYNRGLKRKLKDNDAPASSKHIKY